MKRRTTDAKDEKHIEAKDVSKILDVLSDSIERKMYWHRIVRKLKECLTVYNLCDKKKLITDETQQQYLRVVEKLMTNEPNENICEVVGDEISLIETMQSYCISFVQPQIATKYSQILKYKQILSQDAFEFGKGITSSIENIKSISSSLKKARLTNETGEFDKATILNQEVISTLTLTFKILINELKNKPTKRVWGKISTKPFVKICEENPQLWNDEQKELLLELSEIISNKYSEKQKPSSYEEALTKWNQAEIRMNK
ncbi:hypothetical protein EDI_289780 [Entamoeba dispar SAW760]|uniref:Uncharacterized protein n=1 Tax=Entamoeba dispar (strain ATCC PRA-260 / SAW760) TaxID=370354 RepID=B0EVD2_ENTDS|nr:uncharacterized protein EDI_289780 [Entamoeba dispar SAW760]EDR21544.1 hypothetical protein EDI_289780 [Entamoeba dispar SAW760]|eukprot:EDR21544.1 hypothetical protein EDI_289780 [Entamoeba dispar SAW760]